MILNQKPIGFDMSYGGYVLLDVMSRSKSMEADW